MSGTVQRSEGAGGHPWIGRILGYGEIDLLTASEAGTSKIRFVPDADGFKRMSWLITDAEFEEKKREILDRL